MVLIEFVIRYGGCTVAAILTLAFSFQFFLFFASTGRTGLDFNGVRVYYYDGWFENSRGLHGSIFNGILWRSWTLKRRKTKSWSEEVKFVFKVV